MPSGRSDAGCSGPARDRNTCYVPAPDGAFREEQGMRRSKQSLTLQSLALAGLAIVVSTAGLAQQAPAPQQPPAPPPFQVIAPPQAFKTSTEHYQYLKR